MNQQDQCQFLPDLQHIGIKGYLPEGTRLLKELLNGFSFTDWPGMEAITSVIKALRFRAGLSHVFILAITSWSFPRKGPAASIFIDARAAANRNDSNGG